MGITLFLKKILFLLLSLLTCIVWAVCQLAAPLSLALAQPALEEGLGPTSKSRSQEAQPPKFNHAKIPVLLATFFTIA